MKSFSPHKAYMISPNPPPLYDVLKAGYTNDANKQQNMLSPYGYNLDKELSNSDHSVYSNGKNVIYNVNGTQNSISDGKIFRDWKNNALIQTGYGETTKRYKDEEATLNKVREKYKNENVILTAHSQGGYYTTKLAKPQDTILNYNKESVPFSPTPKNETAYRTLTDVVSLPSATAKHSKTITYLPQDILKSHDLENLKGTKIKVKSKYERDD